jgi:hypothetical protein
MKKEIWINRTDLKVILDVLDRFKTGDENVKVVQTTDGSGIGYTTEVQLDHTVHDTFCTVIVPIVTHEDW